VLDRNDGKLFDALRTLGRAPSLRAKLVNLCREIENGYELDAASIREEVTGPIVDALHSKNEILRRVLKNGLLFDFYYRSNIARDLVLAPEGELDHLFEPQTTKLLLYLARGSAHVLIGGAYAGDHVIQVAKALSGTGVVHAFEPDPEQFEMMRHNVTINRLSNVAMNRLALWSDETSRLRLTGFDACAHAEVVEAHENSVATATIDDYGGRLGISRFGVFLLDLEGSDLAALKGARRYLQEPAGRAPDIIFEINRRYVDWSNGLENTEIIQYLQGLGYTVYCIRDFQSYVSMPDDPIEIIPPESTYIEGPPHGFNLLAVKDDAILKEPFFVRCEDVSPKLLLHKDPALHHPLSWRHPRPGSSGAGNGQEPAHRRRL
jgi:FkbM family methyltransferase